MRSGTFAPTVKKRQHLMPRRCCLDYPISPLGSVNDLRGPVATPVDRLFVSETGLWEKTTASAAVDNNA